MCCTKCFPPMALSRRSSPSRSQLVSFQFCFYSSFLSLLLISAHAWLFYLSVSHKLALLHEATSHTCCTVATQEMFRVKPWVWQLTSTILVNGYRMQNIALHISLFWQKACPVRLLMDLFSDIILTYMKWGTKFKCSWCGLCASAGSNTVSL